MAEPKNSFDAIVIGSGFGGAVTACRLVEAGFDVCLLERGRRFGPDDFPRLDIDALFHQNMERSELNNQEDRFSPPPDASRWLWEADHGIYDVRDLGDAVSVQAAGYGGGSLVYANVHLRPPYSLFDERWPAAYRGEALKPYFDLAAYMLRATPIPKRLNKTLQHKRAADTLQHKRAADLHVTWFRTPLAVTFTDGGTQDKSVNPFKRLQQPCDMRARCVAGCDRQAKNTLDLNYLARAEDGGPGAHPRPDIRTLAEVIRIKRAEDEALFAGKRFRVVYRDLLSRGDQEEAEEQEEREKANEGSGAVGPRESEVTADYVFLCAGTVGTTELLFKNQKQLWKVGHVPRALGSHYFTNASSVSMVFNCREPHEADYGPTITAAVLRQGEEDPLTTQGDSRSPQYSLDIHRGAKEKVPVDVSFMFVTGRAPRSASGKPSASQRADVPRPGMLLTTDDGGVMAALSHDALRDWGSWCAADFVGTLVIVPLLEPPGDVWKNGTAKDKTIWVVRVKGDKWMRVATAVVRAAPRRHDYWFLAEDGGFPPELERVFNGFRSPLWVRRNRFLEGPRPRFVPPRPFQSRLLLEPLTRSQGQTSRRGVSKGGARFRSFNFSRSLAPTPALPAFAQVSGGDAIGGSVLTSGLLGIDLASLLPHWFMDALQRDGNELLDQAAASALPLLGQVLREISRSAADQLDQDLVKRLANNRFEPKLIEELFRGLLRLGLQVLAGGEAKVARDAARVVLGGTPLSAGHLLDRVANALLWALSYDNDEGQTGMLLLMGRDLHRGRLAPPDPAPATASRTDDCGPLQATLAPRILDSTSVLQERVSRKFASGWQGELRTNPVWTPLGTHVTVHSQGGCPMGEEPFAVTQASGEVYGCDGLYVMDAAAFPTSVGVNPSATIAAVAEYKVEQFIRTRQHNWEARDKSRAIAWVDEQRELLDPLNSPNLRTSARAASADSVCLPDFLGLGMTFDEEMKGFLSNRKVPMTVGRRDLETILHPGALRDFRHAEDEGIKASQAISLELHAKTRDLARVVAPTETGIERPKFVLRGSVVFNKNLPKPEKCAVRRGSFLQLFLPSSTRPDVRFFRYHVNFDRDGDHLALEGVKVLRDAKGFDLWHDTSTLYIVVTNHTKQTAQRGILRVPVDVFLKKQLSSMTVTGTKDAARMSWALVAFYKYFATELLAVYETRAKHLADAFLKLVTAVHV